MRARTDPSFAEHIKETRMPPASTTPDRQAAATSARDTLTLGVLLLAPVLLVFPLSIFGETFGWVAGISLGWLAGLALLWSSTSWDPGEKGLATLVWPGGLAPALLLATTVGEVCERTAGGAEMCAGSTLPVWLGLPILAGSVAAPLIVAVVLLRRSGVRRATVEAQPRASP
jgi:hypothetical protein